MALSFKNRSSDPQLQRIEVFMALMSVVILGRRLNVAQWCSMLVISLALLLSTVAEGKGGKKGISSSMTATPLTSVGRRLKTRSFGGACVGVLQT